MKKQNIDPRIDTYIEKATPFAQPILDHIRSLVHQVCPNVEETMKWSFPHFDYKGAMMCSMASFKNHMAFGFWKASIMEDPYSILQQENRTAMGHLGKIKTMKDLPKDKIMLEYIKQAMILNEQGIKIVKAPVKSAPKKEVIVPDYFIKALGKNIKALETFENFSPSHRREYINWITEAKTETTRDKRLATAIEWLSEGKIKDWKYVRK